ncbi:MAG TPA: hypothetical protein VJQ78_07295 [Sphingobium sp.]|nr:hypothetical protein [Sphingobium sp.]
MAKYMIIGLNGPVAGEGNEEAYNRWYDEVHIPDLKAVPGIVSARRFKTMQPDAKWPYAAVYEIETDDLPATMKGMSSVRPMDPAFDKENSSNIMLVQISE